MRKTMIVLISAMLLVSLIVACTPRSIVTFFSGIGTATDGDAYYASCGGPVYVSDVNAMIASFGNLILTSSGEVVYVPFDYSTDGNAFVTDGNAWATNGNAG